MVQHLERPPGRNDPCPCGSGKKYKRCCLGTEAALRPVRTFDDIMAEIYAADEIGDTDEAMRALEAGRAEIHHADLDWMMVERLLELPPEDAERRLRVWWESERDRFSAAGLAKLLLHDGRVDEALDVLSTSHGLEAPAEFWRLNAQLQDEAGRDNAAIAAYEMYCRMVPDDAESWGRLADVQARAGLSDRALVSLRRAAEAAPGQLAPRLLRVQLLARDGHWREARDVGETLLDDEFDDATPAMIRDLRDTLAQAYFSLGDFDAARAILADLLEATPEDAALRLRLATLELAASRPRRALLVLDSLQETETDRAILDVTLRCLLALDEFPEAEMAARALERLEPGEALVPLVRGAQAVFSSDYAWALEYLSEQPPDRYADLWHSLRLTCFARLGQWDHVLPELKAVESPDERVLVAAALGAMATNRLDLAEKLVAAMGTQTSLEARSLSGLIGPLRGLRRAAEVRRQQQVDQAELQRRANESRDLRRQVHDLEEANEHLSAALDEAREELAKMSRQIGLTDTITDVEAWLSDIGRRAQQDAVARERSQAESTLRSILGSDCWNGLSESVRTALRDAEHAFSSEGEIRDYGTVLMGYARGLESAFKDCIFRPALRRWHAEPGMAARLQDEGHDPSLGPFVRYLMQQNHMTLGSMAAVLGRMGDPRRVGVAIDLLRSVVGVQRDDERALADWRRTADRLAQAAEARNRPAHAATVTYEELHSFRQLVLGTDGLLRALAESCL